MTAERPATTSRLNTFEPTTLPTAISFAPRSAAVTLTAEEYGAVLEQLDVLVDGRFVQAEHDISLRFRGSRNQRLLDVPKSLAAGEPVWWQDEQVFSTHTM